MLFSKDKGTEILTTDVHCPYCDTNHAVLLSKTESKGLSFQLPAYGLKFILSLLYLAVIQIWIHGFKTFEVTKEIRTVTYAFCPNCGNSYSMNPPEIIREETKEPKFYRVRTGKMIMGMCAGISEYTGIALLWIRIVTIFYALTIIGAIVYFLAAVCIPFREDVEKEENDAE